MPRPWMLSCASTFTPYCGNAFCTASEVADGEVSMTAFAASVDVTAAVVDVAGRTELGVGSMVGVSGTVVIPSVRPRRCRRARSARCRIPS